MFFYMHRTLEQIQQTHGHRKKKIGGDSSIYLCILLSWILWDGYRCIFCTPQASSHIIYSSLPPSAFHKNMIFEKTKMLA